MQVLSAPNGATHHSVIHSLDSRTKMGLSLVASVAVLVLSDPVSLGLLVAASTLYALALRRYTAVAICYGLFIVLSVVAYGFIMGMHWLWPKIPVAEPAKLVVPFMRSLVMANVVMGLALSSRVQSILTALKSLHLPYCISIPTAVMIRFIPSFLTDMKQIAETMRTRGHRLTPLLLITRPRMTLRLILTPMLFRALRTSDELAIAAELKGLGMRRRITPYKTTHFSRRDGIAAVLAALLLVAGVVLHIAVGSPSGAMF